MADGRRTRRGGLARRALVVYGRLPEGLRRRCTRFVAPSFTVGALCVVERADGRWLLVRHSYRPAWGLPGGLLDRGEEIAVGARREVREEVGLDVDLVGEPTVVVDTRWRRVDVVYRASPRADADPDAVDPVSVELVEVAWFEPPDLPELQSDTADALLALARATTPQPGLDR